MKGIPEMGIKIADLSEGDQTRGKKKKRKKEEQKKASDPPFSLRHDINVYAILNWLSCSLSFLSFSLSGDESRRGVDRGPGRSTSRASHDPLRRT